MIKDKELSEDEIIRDWTLDAPSKKLVERTNKNHRLWFAVQLFAMKRYGRLLENPHELSGQVINYISKQLNLPLSFIIEKPARKATYIDHRKLIFDHLNFKNFEDRAVESLTLWTTNRLNQGVMLLDHLYPQAEQFLVAHQIALPSASQLKRFLKSLCFQYQNTLFQKIYHSLPQNLIHSMDSLLEVESEKESWFNQFKEYPGAASITALKLYLARYQKLNEMNLDYEFMGYLSSDFMDYLYQLGRYYSADKMKRLKTDKRYTIMVVFLKESKKRIIDYIIQLHDQYIADICRECSIMNEEQLRQYRYKHEKAIDKFIAVIDHILCLDAERVLQPKELYKNIITEDLLKEASEDVKIYQRIIRFGYAHLLQNRYNSMRRYFVDFITVPFYAETENSNLMTAIQLIQKMDNNVIKSLPNDAPQDFIASTIKRALRDKDGNLKRNIWKIGVAIALRDALRSGDIYSPESKKHVSFWNLVYNKNSWEEARSQTYTDLHLTQNAQSAVEDLKEFFYKTASFAQKNIGKDGFASIKNGKLKLNKPDKLIIPDHVKALQKKITSCLPKIKIEQLLLEVDHMTGFSRHFTPNSVYNTQVISCSPREALYVLDGLLENNTVLEIKDHTTDTAGYTEHVFALCYLLGFNFMPRIRDLKDQQLYKIDKTISYGDLDTLLDKTIDLNLIEEQWDQMIRVVGSLKNKLAPAHEIIRRLGKRSPSDRLSKAFTQLGRLIKTEYILRYLTTPELRQKVQRQLNKGEHRHALSRWIFFANQGKFQVGDYEEIMNKASCLSLVSNAVLLWNTVNMEQIIKALKANGETIDEETLSHISLLPYKHVIPMGTYFVEAEHAKILL